ncbi:hypothetical protein PI124_g2548 [Phytophthora idaei]|nr:hypothetical protein PI125_g5999 [Phytophthora idaei]KAG3164054.1 hypothetical protein PI126_g5265 [Phytophthora idaei]KAG3252868.1 hypothetical protein PI124_g2548 [Phytophthora idaei]
MPQDFEQMDSTLWIKNAKYFGDKFQPGEGQVHVLVVVPKQERGLSLETAQDVPQLGGLLKALTVEHQPPQFGTNCHRSNWLN